MTVLGLALTACNQQQFELASDMFSIIPDTGGGHGGGGNGQGPNASCVPGEVSLNQKKIRRLTRSQINLLVTRTYSSNSFKNLDYAAFEEAVADKGFTGESERSSIDRSTLDRWVSSVEKISANVYASQAPIPAACKADFTKNTCIEDQLVKYSKKLLRRPPTPAELAEVQTGIAKIKAQGASLDLQISFLHKYLLYNPTFFYRTELGFGSLNNKNNIVELDPYEIASFLSYSITDDAPDDILYDKAEQGLLKDLSVIEKEVERLAALPSAKVNLNTLLMDFLKLNTVSNIAGDKFSKYTYSADYAIPGTVRNNLAKRWHDQSFRVKHGDLLGQAKQFIDLRLGNDLNYMNIFSGNVFPVNNRTVAIYGVRDKESLDQLFTDAAPDASNMHYTFATNYTANPNERYGIFSHPAYLSVHSKENDTGMVHRGVFFLEQLLCSELPGSPADVFPVNELPPGYDPTVLTSRKKFEILHSQQSACFFCHKTIDNIGGSFESFDQTGFFQKTETFQYEKKWYTLPIDSSGQLTGVGDVNISYNNTVDFIKKIQQTSHFKKCVNTKLLEFINGEKSNAANSCGYAVKADQLARSPSSTFKDLILSNIKDTNFFRRRTEGGQ